jgi:hypothetical protein
MCFCGFAAAQSIDSTGVWKMVPDSAAVSISPLSDSAAYGSKTDSLRASAPAAAKQPEVSSLKLIKRSYNSRQQLLLASGMMIFVITMMTAAQQWNPD